MRAEPLRQACADIFLGHALLAITASNLSDDEHTRLANLPSQVFYGVATDEAIALRLLGVPRKAATPLAKVLKLDATTSLPTIRQRLSALTERDWLQALGPVGGTYRKAWQIMDGTLD